MKLIPMINRIMRGKISKLFFLINLFNSFILQKLFEDIT